MVFAPAVAANASVSVGGWTALDTITAGATNTINAVKGAGATGMRSAIAVAPSAVKVGKFLIKGGGTAALLLAVPQIIGDGVDWVLDPANNSITYTPKGAGSCGADGGGCPASGYVWSSAGENFPSAAAACRNELLNFTASFPSMAKSTVRTEIFSVQNANCHIDKYYDDGSFGGTNTYQIGAVPNENHNPVEEKKHIPIDVVAAKVISNAVAGNAPSQEVVKATALEGFAAGDYDAALDAAAVPDTGVENPTDPNNPAEPVDPAKPFDPAGIISAINAVKAMIAGLVAAVVGLSDFFQSEPPPEKPQKDTDVPIDDLPPTKSASEFDVNYINFGGQCPVLPSFNIGIGGASSALTFDMTPLCDMALKIRPAVIAIAYFIGLGVIASAIRET